MQAPPERLGAFYLGAEYELKKDERTETPINYDARDLTTHAVCVGMTGSGKTGGYAMPAMITLSRKWFRACCKNTVFK